MTDNIPNTMLEEPGTIGEIIMQKLGSVFTFFSSNAGELLWGLIVVAFILLMSKLLLALISQVTTSVMENEKYHPNILQGKRIDTMMTLVRSAARYSIYFIAILLILRQFNLFDNMKGLVVTAGIGSLAIGFGAQNLVKDVVTGFFMLFENQFSVGDYIKTEEAEGTVEATAVRVTYLRTFKGEQIIIPNGSISRVTNLSRGDNVAVITISTAYEADTRATIAIIEEAVQKFASENTDVIKEPPIVQGITGFAASSVEIGVICKVNTMKQWQVERGMRLAIKEMFDEKGISFPYPHVVTVDYNKQTHPQRGKLNASSRPAESMPEQPDWANTEEN
ncbi:MAG: mechanosensitive ion channel family protein [Hydrogenoanaerobacterium sp.]